MKKLFISLITIYQAIFSTIFKNIVGVSRSCRFEITCSEYAKIQIQEKGILRGGLLAIKRVLSCQPYYNGASV